MPISKGNRKDAATVEVAVAAPVDLVDHAPAARDQEARALAAQGRADRADHAPVETGTTATTVARAMINEAPVAGSVVPADFKIATATAHRVRRRSLSGTSSAWKSCRNR
jgi:hypothetical protein